MRTRRTLRAAKQRWTVRGLADVARAARRFETLRTDAGLPVSYHLLTLDLER